ncbi:MULTISPECIES: major capsid protein [unclassified Glutamicibacter]|uniref:major capsid protein n=1 Tax=unclassified Glutamicibacter TaxID=2627139 RepID=UPI000BB867B0|nr:MULTISPECIES: major capsid protein [unclassified Glutamicibacter]PCC29733.1 major capsid protein E [Glutamicibacter sp. BW80]PCC31444.1 major capsid protein E [Glutamicibacter sp. BW77]
MSLVLSSDYITPTELTGYVRSALADLPQNAFGLSAYLPDVPTDDIDFRASVGGGGLSRAASYRSYDTESPISGRRGISRIHGELPPISEKRRLGEYDRLKMRKLDEGIKNAILNDAVELATAIKARLEIARGDALMNGSVTVSENGLALEADFGRAANHSQTAIIRWDQADSDPINDLLAWVGVYVATNGVRPAEMLASEQLVSVLMRNSAIRGYVLPAGSTQNIVTIDALNALLASFRLPTLVTYDAQVEVEEGVAQSILDPKRILFLPPAGKKLGETLWGVTAEALDENYGIDSTEAPGIVVGSYSDNDPVAQWTKASAIALPVVPNANLTLSGLALT